MSVVGTTQFLHFAKFADEFSQGEILLVHFDIHFESQPPMNTRGPEGKARGRLTTRNYY